MSRRPASGSGRWPSPPLRCLSAHVPLAGRTSRPLRTRLQSHAAHHAPRRHAGEAGGTDAGTLRRQKPGPKRRPASQPVRKDPAPAPPRCGPDPNPARANSHASPTSVAMSGPTSWLLPLTWLGRQNHLPCWSCAPLPLPVLCSCHQRTQAMERPLVHWSRGRHPCRGDRAPNSSGLHSRSGHTIPPRYDSVALG
jgi:hypothetical protein